jgi:hypothetical protein
MYGEIRVRGVQCDLSTSNGPVLRIMHYSAHYGKDRSKSRNSRAEKSSGEQLKSSHE